MSKNSYTVTVEEEGGELVMELPKELLDEMNWSVGTTLNWSDNGDGTFSLSAIDETN